MMKKFLTIIFLFDLICFASVLGEEEEDYYTFKEPLIKYFDSKIAVKDLGNKKFDEQVTSRKLIDEMGFGWNLGNTFDAFISNTQNQGLDSETCWGVDYTTEESIESLASKGIKTIRIPVTWHNHFIDDYYTIDPEWMERVKTVVDWAIDKKLYVIINTHHDNAGFSTKSIRYASGYYPLRKDMAESEKFLYNVWTQIATAFNNGYEHHLIFEGLNEPRLQGTKLEWNYLRGEPICEEASSVLNEYNRLIVKAIRQTGGNNEHRFIMVSPLAAAYSSAINQDFIFPGDTKYNPSNQKILLSIHMYLPYNFAMNEDMTFKTFEKSYENELYNTFKSLYEKFTLNGHGVIIGEMGTINKNNTEARIAWAKYYIQNSRKFQMACILWDNEKFDNSKSAAETFGHYQRAQLKWYNDDLMNTYIDSAEIKFEDNPAEKFPKSLLSESIVFDEWLENFFVSVRALSALNSYGKIEFSTEEPEDTPIYRELHLFLGDWSTHLNFTKDELEDANINKDGGIALSRGKHNVVITLSEKNLGLAKEKGLYIIGHGFIMTRFALTGPQLSKMSPLIMEKSSELQKLNLQFDSNATSIVDKITFSNLFYNLNDKVSCELDEKDISLVICEGVFDFTGKYYLTDGKGTTLTARALNIISKDGESDINNLIDEKVNLDTYEWGPGIKLSPNKLSEIKEGSILVIETNDLAINPSYKTLFFYLGSSTTPIIFPQKNVNKRVGADGGISVIFGRDLIQIKLESNGKNIKENGLTIRGYGLGINAIFVKNPELEEE